MHDGPPSSSEDANASVTGGAQPAVRGAALGGVDQRGRREADQDRPVTVGGHRREQRGHRRRAVLTGDAAADDEVVLRALLEAGRQHLGAVGRQRVHPVDLLVDVEVEPEVVEQDHADHGRQGQERRDRAGVAPGLAGGRSGVRGCRRRSRSAGGRGGGVCPGNGGIGPLRRDGRLSGSHDVGVLDRDRAPAGGRAGGRPRAPAGDRPGGRPRAPAADRPGRRAAGRPGCAATCGTGSSTRRAARRRPTALP